MYPMTHALIVYWRTYGRMFRARKNQSIISADGSEVPYHMPLELKSFRPVLLRFPLPIPLPGYRRKTLGLLSLK
jgi:hypothetical protein